MSVTCYLFLAICYSLSDTCYLKLATSCKNLIPFAPVVRLALVLSNILRSLVYGEPIVTYFLNSDYSYHTRLCHTCPDIECLHTSPDLILSLTNQVTICYRSQPILYHNPLSSWSIVLAFGVINEDFTDMDEGVVFGI